MIITYRTYHDLSVCTHMGVSRWGHRATDWANIKIIKDLAERSDCSRFERCGKPLLSFWAATGDCQSASIWASSSDLLSIWSHGHRNTPGHTTWTRKKMTKCEVSFRPMRSFARVGNPRQHPGASNAQNQHDNRWWKKVIGVICYEVFSMPLSKWCVALGKQQSAGPQGLCLSHNNHLSNIWRQKFWRHVRYGFARDSKREDTKIPWYTMHSIHAMLCHAMPWSWPWCARFQPRLSHLANSVHNVRRSERNSWAATSRNISEYLWMKQWNSVESVGTSWNQLESVLSHLRCGIRILVPLQNSPGCFCLKIAKRQTSSNILNFDLFC